MSDCSLHNQRMTAGTHNFHGNSRATGSGSVHPGSRDGTMRWLPELPPAMKILSAATEPGDVGQPQVGCSLTAKSD